MGGLAWVKEEPAAAGRGARRRGTPLSILGFRVGAVIAGGGGAVAWGSPEKNLGTRGALGKAGAAADRRWGVFSRRAGRRTAGRGRQGAAVWLVVAGGSGGCRLKMNCRPSLNYMSSASLLPSRSVLTVAFKVHSKFQFRQLSSESTVFTSSVVVRWFLVM